MSPGNVVCLFAEIESCCLLFQSILKRTKEGTKEEQTASKALASVSKVNTPHSSTALLPANAAYLSVKCALCFWKLDVSYCLNEGFPTESTQ